MYILYMLRGVCTARYMLRVSHSWLSIASTLTWPDFMFHVVLMPDKLCASDNQPVTLVVLEEVDLYRHFASFRDVMLQVGATLTRLRTATVSAGVAAAAAAEGLPRGDSNVRVMAITGTMTVDLEARIRELMGIRESAFTYRSQAPVRKLPFMVFIGPKPRTEREVSPAYVTIAVDTAVAARAEQRQRNADTADDRARGHAEAVAIEMAALARLTSDQTAAELAAADLPVGDTAGAAAHTAHLGRIAVERSAAASARARADAAALEEVSGIVVVSASRKVAIGICEKAREELLKVDIDCATLHGKNNPNLKGFTASQQQLGHFGLLTATRAGVIGLNYRAHKIVLIGAFNDPSFFIQAAHRVDRAISGIATVELYSDCVHWIAAQVQLRTALSEGQTACKGAVATSPVGRKAIAAVCLREAALADFNEIRGILFGGKCIRVGLSLAMCPESPIRSCINDDAVPLGSACSRCLADAAGWAGGIDVLLEATAQEEMFRILSVLTGDGKNSTTFDLLVAAIKVSPVFKAMKTRDRDRRGTPRLVVLQPQAVAAAVARSALLVEGIEPVHRATGAGAKTAKKGKGAKAAGPVVFQYALRFYDWNKYAAPEGLGGYAAGTFPHNAVIVFPLFHQKEYEEVLSFATELSAKNAGDQPPLAESDNMEFIEEDGDSTDDSAFGSPVIQRRDPGAAGGQDDAITAKIAEITAAVGDVPLMQRLIAELAGLNGASGGLDATRLLKTKAPRGDQQLSQPPEQQAAKKSRAATTATAKGTGSTDSRKKGKKGAKKKR